MPISCLNGYNSSNELTSGGGASYTYDSNGNMLTKTVGNATTSYTWDFENRLASVTLPSGAAVSFRYDPFGRRIQKSSPAGTAIYVYDGANVIQELDGAGNTTARFIQGQGVDEPLEVVNGSTPSYYEADGLGSITSLTDATGAVAASYTYDSFGNQTASTGSIANPYQYTGRELDSETGLYYYRARYYDPSASRFLNEDPIRSGMNFYAYVHNDPISFLDPFGLQDNASPWQVGWGWLTGHGPRTHHFTDGDPFTESLRHHEHIQELINDVCKGNLPRNNRFDYQLGGFDGVPKSLRDYSTLFSGGLTGNLAVTYLGSYGLSYSVTNGTLNIHVWNFSTISSATHPLVIGYTNWWNQDIGTPLDNFFSSGPMSQTSQFFDFHENLKDKCQCKR